MTKIAVQGRSSRDTKISEVMTPNPITVTPKHRCGREVGNSGCASGKGGFMAPGAWPSVPVACGNVLQQGITSEIPAPHSGFLPLPTSPLPLFPPPLSHSVLDVMELMINKNFRHVPVVDEGRLLGMASMRDVVHVMLKEHREEVGRLQEYIQGTF